MVRTITQFIKLSIVLLLYTAVGCTSDKDAVLPLYTNYKFDQKVIEKLPLYDSLAMIISKKLPLFQNIIYANESYQAYRYIPSSLETDVFTKLPDEVSTDIGRYFTTLGNNFIYGFDVFKDSTIKIYIRIYPVQKGQITIDENLSYYPEGKKIRQREFPIKDSMLDTHWQYWTRFNKKGLLDNL